jgi:hypothetical protein
VSNSLSAKKETFTSVAIVVVANGYKLHEAYRPEMAMKEYVFPDMESLLKFLEERLQKPGNT